MNKKESTQQGTPADLVPPKPPTDKYPSDKQASEKKNEAWQPTDWFNLWLVIFTGCLVGVGIAQAIIYRKQAKYMRRGLKLTRKAANAAEESAKVAIQQAEFITHRERPWILVQPDNWEMPNPFAQDFAGPVKWSIMNVGRSPAFITELVVEIDVVPYPPPDVLPRYSPPTPLAKFIIAPNGKHTTTAENILNAAELRSIFESKMCLMFFGYLRYEDTLGNSYRTRFCSTWHILGQYWMFKPVGPSNYIEYT